MNSSQRQYLTAMGVPVWVRRKPAHRFEAHPETAVSCTPRPVAADDAAQITPMTVLKPAEAPKYRLWLDKTAISDRERTLLTAIERALSWPSEQVIWLGLPEPACPVSNEDMPSLVFGVWPEDRSRPEPLKCLPPLSRLLSEPRLKALVWSEIQSWRRTEDT